MEVNTGSGTYTLQTAGRGSLIGWGNGSFLRISVAYAQPGHEFVCPLLTLSNSSV